MEPRSSGLQLIVDKEGFRNIRASSCRYPQVPSPCWWLGTEGEVKMSLCSPAGVLGMSLSTHSSFLRSARSPAAGPGMPGRIPGNAHCSCLQGVNCAPWQELQVGPPSRGTWSCKSSKSSDPACLRALQALDSAHTRKARAPSKSPEWL